MAVTVLFSARPALWSDYAQAVPEACAALGVEARLVREAPSADVDYILCAPNGPVSDFSVYPNLKAVMSLWAGVEALAPNPTIRVPLTRMVDRGLSEGMVQWVLAHVLRHHVGTDAHVVNPDHVWDAVDPPLPGERPVGVLGLGALGQACATALAGLGFPVLGWSRRPREVPGVEAFNGAEGLDRLLARAQILVTLLPDTPGTEAVLNARTISLLPRGAVVINPGRGTLIDDDALLAALDSGQVGHATLDVFRTEPLPQDHPFWAHPGVTVTPHVAAATRVGTASEVVAENIRRGEAGQPFLHEVDRDAGY